MNATVLSTRQWGRRESALPRIEAEVYLSNVGQKNYAESAESQQGIMRTTEVSVQRCSDDERQPMSHTAVVSKHLKDSQENTEESR